MLVKMHASLVIDLIHNTDKVDFNQPK